VAAGGLSRDHSQWVHPRTRNFFLPIWVLRKLFRGKFLDALQQAHASGQLQFHGRLRGLAQRRLFRSLLGQLFVPHWVVYCKPPFGGPEQVLRYLGAYTHRVAISDHRLVSFAEGNVTFRWRDSAHKNKKRLLTLPVDEFLRRFLLHVLPRGFVRIRYFGFLAHRRRRALLPLCTQLLSAAAPAESDPVPSHSDTNSQAAPLWTCPLCGGSYVLPRTTYRSSDSASFSARYKAPEMLKPIYRLFNASTSRWDFCASALSVLCYAKLCIHQFCMLRRLSFSSHRPVTTANPSPCQRMMLEHSILRSRRPPVSIQNA